MPSYKTHDRIGIISAPVIFISGLAVDMPIPVITTITASYLVSTFLLSPDLDTDSKIYRRWGALRFIWYPYLKLVKHRSVYSHSGLFSGTLRFIYLSILLLPLLLVPDAIYLFSEYYIFYVLFWIGMVGADIAHSLSDWLVTRIKTQC